MGGQAHDADPSTPEEATDTPAGDAGEATDEKEE